MTNTYCSKCCGTMEILVLEDLVAFKKYEFLKLAGNSCTRDNGR